MFLKDKFILLLMICLSGLLYHSFTLIVGGQDSISTAEAVAVHQASSSELSELPKRVHSFKVSDKK